jgi:hypothetical protein
MGKRKGKKKKRRNSPANWARGGDFGPLSADALAAQLAQLQGSDGGGRRRSAGPPAREREGADGVDGNGGGERARPGPDGGELRGGSPPPVRFFGGEVVAKYGRVKWVTGVGLIGPTGAYGGRSAARWRVSAVAKPPVRFPAIIEWGKWRVVNVRVWRSSWHNLIERKIAREGEGSSPGQGRQHGCASSIGSGESRGDGRSWCGEDGARVGPFIGARGGRGMGETANTGELAMMAGMALTPIGMARAG